MSVVEIVAENSFKGMVGTLLSENDGVVNIMVDVGNGMEFKYTGQLEDIKVMETV